MPQETSADNNHIQICIFSNNTVMYMTAEVDTKLGALHLKTYFQVTYTLSFYSKCRFSFRFDESVLMISALR